MFGTIRHHHRTFLRAAKENSPEQVPWDAKAEQAFQNLKALLVLSSVMQNPDFAKTFILQIDVSGVGVGAVLSQGEDED